MHPDQLIRRQLLSHLRDPVAMIVNPLRGFVFFAEAERPARLWRCNIDATHCLIIRNITLGRPSGMTIDYATNRLCIGDTLLKYIACMEFDGTNFTTLDVDTPLPVALSIIGGSFLSSSRTFFCTKTELFFCRSALLHSSTAILNSTRLKNVRRSRPRSARF